jgi:1,2-diacylglycerol 3-beta-galactosyltransferase
MGERPRILFLFSDTGGGHRSSAEAIIEALQAKYPGRHECVMLDAFKRYAPKPLDRIPAMYPDMVRVPEAWGLFFRLSNGRRLAYALTAATWPYVKSSVHRLLREQTADLFVSVHPLLNEPFLRALNRPRPAFLTVVTDLVSTHVLWYNRKVDLCLVPTEIARRRGLRYGMRPERIRVAGLPVAQRYCRPTGDREALRKDLGWPRDRPVVLVVGGGEGMGPLFKTARAIARRRGDYAMAVVAGRNERLRERLEAEDWEVPAYIYGFERRLPEMMQAATLLVTKAGPSTITEAINAGLPMVLYSRLPGQEDGNVTYVVREGVGLWAPGPERTAEAVSAWLAQPRLLEIAAETCRRVARPNAAVDVADTIVELLARPNPN